MWEHRNGVLHKQPDKHHCRLNLDKSSAAIEKEWERGQQGLLTKDRFLFRNKETVTEITLEKKWTWLTSVALARQAPADDVATRGPFAQERQGMQSWLSRNQTRQTDETETTENDNRKRQKTNH